MSTESTSANSTHPTDPTIGEIVNSETGDKEIIPTKLPTDLTTNVNSFSLERQLSKNLNVLKAGPRLIVPPAQHLLTTALKLPIDAKKTLIDKNLNRLMSRGNSNSSGSNNDDYDEERILTNIGIQQEEQEGVDDDLYDGIDEENSGRSESEYGDESDDYGNGDEHHDQFVDAQPDLKHLQEQQVQEDIPRSRFSLSKRKMKASPSTSTSYVSPEPRRQTLSPQKLINTISKHSLSPIKKVTPMIRIRSGSNNDKSDTDEFNEPNLEGISRSFAGFLTTASMYAGFQDIEDEDREMESLRHRNYSKDSDNPAEILSGPPENANILHVLDEDDINNGSDAISEISIPTATASVVSSGNDTVFNDSTAEFLKNKKRGSKFEVSVVKKITTDASFDNDGTGLNNKEQLDVLENKAIAMANKLRKAFDIDQSEEFIADYPCWLMGDVLLQGHLYITDNNILFFAFLPKRNKGGISKSGSLSVKSFHSLRMHRKWVILRENTFSVYSSTKDLYFPELVIDLRTTLRAEIYGSSKNTNPLTPVWIRIVTEKRTHWFQADNHDVARNWITSLKKHIFSSRNKGDQVAIKIPLQNVIDLELTSVVGVTKNLRIKVIENAESFAIDDYFVMFFSKGDHAVEDIKTAIDKSGVVISSSIFIDKDDLKNSDMVKSKLEMIKKNCSSVKSTNFRPKDPKEKFRTFRDAILSSDEESEIEDVDERYSSNNDDNDDDDFNKNELESSNKKPEKNRNILKTKFRGRSKSVHIKPETDATKCIEPVLDTTHGDSTAVENKMEKVAGDGKESRRWTTSLFQGITSFTQSLIFAGPVLHFDADAVDAREGQDPYFVKDEKVRETSQKRFVKRFSLNDSEKLIATYHLYLLKGLPIYGKMYIGGHEICFRSTIPGSSTLMILPLTDIETVNKESGFRFGYFGLVIVIRGHEELFFEFSTTESRDDCEIQILKKLDFFKKGRIHLIDKLNGAVNTSIGDNESLEHSVDDLKLAPSVTSLNSAKLKMFENKLTDEVGINVPIIVEEHPLQKTEFKPVKKYRFTLLTIGSRGDVQPYISLGKALLKEGHKVKIVTHAEFKDWVESYGIGFDVIAGDPSELMALMVTHPTINYSFIKEAKAKFRDWIDDLLQTSWKACQDSDVLIESPSSIAGIHIAEKLQIPYFRAFTMPWTRTRAYPNAFMVPDQKLGGAYNYMTHVAFENGYWRGTCYQVNKWRVETLNLPKTTLGAMHQNSVPFLYNISPVVFPPSVDFPEWVKVTGYWFLDESSKYEPPKELLDFIQKARDDNKKLVYIGFGSIVVNNPKELTQAVVDAVLESDVRCILNKGWSDRLGSKNKKELEIQLPDGIFNAGNIPHDWLFTKIDAAVHHGGSGTTGASLRFGLPTIVKPFFGDQKFYASRVEDLGCGVALRTLESKSLAKALKEVTTNSRIIEKAKQVGESIRSENGVQEAVNSIYVLMDYAGKLSVSKHKQELTLDEARSGDEEPVDVVEDADVEGSWLLV